MSTLKQRYATAYITIAIYVLSAILLFHSFAASSLWWWQWVSFVPGWMWLFIPLSTLVLFLFRRKNLLLIACVIITFPLAFAQSDINMGAFFGASDVASTERSVRIFSWNSLAWRQSDKQAWVEYIKSHEADIYFLQEVIRPKEWETPSPDALTAVFPGYRLIPFGEWITITRLPVVGVYGTKDQFWLRVDVDIQGTRTSLYNVHIPVHISPQLALRSPGKFFVDMKERFELRQTQFALLEQELSSNTYPKIITGDFNTTKSMGSMNSLLSKYSDASGVGQEFIPATWGDMGLVLWRIDWALISKELTALSYRILPDTNLSDHRAYTFQVEVPTSKD